MGDGSPKRGVSHSGAWGGCWCFCLNPSVTSHTLQSPGPHRTVKTLCNLPILTLWKAAVSQLLLRLLWAPGVPPCLSVAHSCWALSTALRFPFLWDLFLAPKEQLRGPFWVDLGSSTIIALFTPDCHTCFHACLPTSPCNSLRSRILTQESTVLVE